MRKKIKIKIDRRKQKDYRKKSIIILIIYERLHLFLNFYTTKILQIAFNRMSL